MYRTKSWLRILVGCALAGAICLHPISTSAQQTVVIQNDRGGVISSRSSRVESLRSSGRRVEIRGVCLSACTMMLGAGNICVDPNATLGFHGPTSYGRRLQPQDFEYWSQEVARHYSPALRSWYLNTARHRTSGYHKLSGRDLIRMGYRQC